MCLVERVPVDTLTMSDGGSIVNEVTARRSGEETTVLVVVSGDSVEIGGLAFSRADLLFALGAAED
jgi:hypothetical protein